MCLRRVSRELTEYRLNVFAIILMFRVTDRRYFIRRNDETVEILEFLLATTISVRDLLTGTLCYVSNVTYKTVDVFETNTDSL